MPLQAPRQPKETPSIALLMTEIVDAMKGDQELWATLQADPELKKALIRKIKENLERQVEIERQQVDRRQDDEGFWARFLRVFSAP